MLRIFGIKLIFLLGKVLKIKDKVLIDERN